MPSVLARGPHEAVAADFPIDPADLIAGLGRGFTVVEAFDDEHWRMTIAEAAERTGIPRSATRRYLLSLCHFGYAETDGKQYWLSPRVLRLGQGYLEAARLPRLVRPVIQQISTALGETVNVSVLDGDEVLYVARSNSPRLVSIGFHPGARAPAHVVSPGIVLLSTLKEAALQQWAGAHDFAGYTAHTVTDGDTFLELVSRARAQDYWVTAGQLDAGLTGIAVPLKNRRGRCVAAMGMTVQTVQWGVDRIVDKLLPALREAAKNLRPIL